jgi:ABC-type uncharacterized transport system YnjBCD substrate-binding protein
VTPVAKTQKDLVWYGFNGLCESQVKAAAEFTKETGIAVKHVCVEGDQGVQQLIAERQGGKPSAADVFFGPNNSMRQLTAAGVVANLPLADLLPNTADVDPNAGRVSRGFKHGGTVVPWHRNQTSLAYNSTAVKNPPQSFEELLAFAQQNSGKVTVTDPTKGGSGSGFLESTLLRFSANCKADFYNFDLTKEQAEAIATRCMAPVLTYWAQLKPHVRFSSSNANSILAIANNTALVATVWEDDLYLQASKGLVPPSVRPILLKSGQVGDGDGMFILSSTRKTEAALLLVNYLMSDKIQIGKLETIGSRSARQRLATEGKIPAKLAQYLLPDAMFRERARPRINGQITDAAAAIFVREVIAK